MHHIIVMFRSSVDESALLDLIGYDQIHLIPTLVSKRAEILSEWNDAVKIGIAKSSTNMGQTLSQVRFNTASSLQRMKQMKKKSNVIQGYDDEIELLSQLGWGGNTSVPTNSANVGTLKVVLPEGTTRHVFDTFEEYRIPALVMPQSDSERAKLIPVTVLPEWARPVFSSDSAYFNPVQSRIFPTAFDTNDNFIACAPTGAGKTNVALLAVCRCIREWKSMPNPPVQPNFKIVYLAPMKALVSEIVEKFKSKLKLIPGMKIREFTADISIPKKELDETNIIVTVPEKWDILMRNMGRVGGTSNNPTDQSPLPFLSQIKLMIIDEIHLLNEERGAVIESIVARTMQLAEKNFSRVRFVALSATFPNYGDIADFLGISKPNTFFFDSSFRPVPLEQTVTGVGGPVAKSAYAQVDALNKVLAEKVKHILAEGQQVMVFVHSRNDTVKTAQALIDLLTMKGVQLGPGNPDSYLLNQKSGSSSSSRVRSQMNQFITAGITIHHAGMLRPERSLAENFFREGVANILVCTATLAWGVNLPSRYVIIKGTSIWDSAVGGFKEIELMDILQIFGRAGRPQFDHIGRATLITSRDKLDYFIRLLTSQIPIESTLHAHLADALNAEIALGNIGCLSEAVEWLSYTYLFVRFFKAPQKYGILPADLAGDPDLLLFRQKLIMGAADKLNSARLVRLVANGDSFSSTSLGRVAAQFYLKYETAEMFATRIDPAMTDSQILELVGDASEFSQLKCREDEMAELESVLVDKEVCPVSRVRGGGVSSVSGKVAILIQTYISNNYYFQSSSLASDMNYISQNANRLFRALFEISLTRSVECSGVAVRLLEWSKMVERRIWTMDMGGSHFLRHYTKSPGWLGSDGGHMKCLRHTVVDQIEAKRMHLDTVIGLTRKEIESIAKGSPEGGKSLEIFLRRIPQIHVSTRIIPITADLVRVDISLELANITDWSWSGTNEPFHLFLTDSATDDVFHHHHFNFRKLGETELEVSTHVPLVEPRPAQLSVTIVSDRYVGLEFFDVVTVPKVDGLLAESVVEPTDLLDLHPLRVSSVFQAENESTFASLFSFTHFNPIQTQLFWTMYNSDVNVLCGCPTGSGKTVIAELAILRVLKMYPNKKIVYIAPQKALSKERISDWERRLGRGSPLQRSVVELTGDFTPDIRALGAADIIVTTPEKWDGVSRGWRTRNYVANTALVILDEIHMLGQERGAVLEIIVSRMRLIAEETKCAVRFIGLSTALANSAEVANWLGVGKKSGLFNFRPSVRPVPMTVHIQGFPEKHYCPRMATMNKPCVTAIAQYSPEKPTIVFVSSRRQTRLTAFDLITYSNMQTRWLAPGVDAAEIVGMVSNDALKHTLAFGVGIHHAGLPVKDREVVEELFRTRKIQVLVATSTLAVGINLPSHLVIVKGTEYFDPKKKKYVDMPMTDVLQMMGRAGRPQFDTSAVAVVMVEERKKNFYRKFLYSPFPLESSLHTQLGDHLNAEIANGAIRTVKDATEFLSWTYLFRRVSTNPSFYMTNTKQSPAQYISQLLRTQLDELESSHCIVQTTEGVFPTKVGQIASMYYLRHATVAHYWRSLSGKKSSVLELMKILADSSEFAEFPMRHKDDEYNAILASQFPIDLTSLDMKSPHTKAFLVQLLHMFPIEPPVADYFTDLRSFVDQSVRMIQGMLEILLEQRNTDLTTVLNLLLLNQSLAIGGSVWEDPVKIWKRGHKGSLAELVEMKHNSVKNLPIMRVKGSQAANGITVTVSQLNKTDEFAVTPGAVVPGKRRRVAWWVILAKGSVVFGAKRVMMSGRERAVKIEPSDALWRQYNDQSVKVFLVSDCYRGLDQEIIIE